MSINVFKFLKLKNYGITISMINEKKFKKQKISFKLMLTMKLIFKFRKLLAILLALCFSNIEMASYKCKYIIESKISFYKFN